MAVPVSQPTRESLMKACKNDIRLVRELENLFLAQAQVQDIAESLNTLLAALAGIVDVDAGTVQGEITDTTDTLIASSTTLSDNTGANLSIISNSPVAGAPTKWITIDDNGTPRYIPTWG